jgi:hypothetical protein
MPSSRMAQSADLRPEAVLSARKGKSGSFGAGKLPRFF